MSESINGGLDNQDSEKIWATFKNPQLIKDLQALSALDKREIARIGEALAADSTFFRAVATKPHGIPRPKENPIDHRGFTLKGDLNEVKDLGTQIANGLSEDQRRAMPMKQITQSQAIKIYDHPNDPDQIVVTMQLQSPARTSKYDTRPTNNQYTLIIPKDSKAAESLRGQQTPKHIPFALSYAAAKLNPKAAEVFFDIPLTGFEFFNDPNKINTFTIVDFPRSAISRWRIQSGQESPPNHAAIEPGKFLDMTALYGATSKDNFEYFHPTSLFSTWPDADLEKLKP
jgi:hypothetical protein